MAKGSSTTGALQDIGTLPPPFIFNLPGETLLTIFNRPELSEDDLANLRYVCKQINPYATEVVAKRRFSTKFCLGFSKFGLVRLSQICSSALGPYLTLLCLKKPGREPWITKLRMQPSYSFLREINVEHLDDSMVSTFKAIIAKADHLEVFTLSTRPEFCYTDRSHQVRGRPNLASREGFQTGNGMFPSTFRSADKVIENISSDHLRRLDLLIADFPMPALIAVLTKHQSTIKELKFYDCQLVQGRWCDVMAWIKANLPTLEYLRIQGLFTANGKKLPRGDISIERNLCQKDHVQGPSALEYKGNKDIRKGLDDLIASIAGK